MTKVQVQVRLSPGLPYRSEPVWRNGALSFFTVSSLPLVRFLSRFGMRRAVPAAASLTLWHRLKEGGVFVLCACFVRVR